MVDESCTGFFLVQLALCSLIYYSMSIFIKLILNFKRFVRLVQSRRFLCSSVKSRMMLHGPSLCDTKSHWHLMSRCIILLGITYLYSNSIISFFKISWSISVMRNFSHLLFGYVVVQFLKENINKCLIVLFISFKNSYFSWILQLVALFLELWWTTNITST